MFFKTGPLWKQTHISRALHSTTFGVPSKGVLSPGPLTQLPQRELLCFQSPPSFIFQSPRYTSPLPVSPAVPTWREMPVSSLQAVSLS